MAFLIFPKLFRLRLDEKLKIAAGAAADPRLNPIIVIDGRAERQRPHQHMTKETDFYVNVDAPLKRSAPHTAE